MYLYCFVFISVYVLLLLAVLVTIGPSAFNKFGLVWYCGPPTKILGGPGPRCSAPMSTGNYIGPDQDRWCWLSRCMYIRYRDSQMTHHCLAFVTASNIYCMSWAPGEPACHLLSICSHSARRQCFISSKPLRRTNGRTDRRTEAVFQSNVVFLVRAPAVTGMRGNRRSRGSTPTKIIGGATSTSCSPIFFL